MEIHSAFGNIRRREMFQVPLLRNANLTFRHARLLIATVSALTTEEPPGRFPSIRADSRIKKYHCKCSMKIQV